MKFISLKGNKVTLDLTLKERDILFRAGLQLLQDKWFGHKVVVLPVIGKLGKDFKKVKLADGVDILCIQEAFNQALREYLDKEDKKPLLTRLIDEARPFLSKRMERKFFPKSKKENKA